MKFKQIFLKPCFLIFISAVLSALPFTFDFLFMLSWISLVPFYFVILKTQLKLRQMLGYGFLFGIIYYISIYYWFVWFYPVNYANLNNILSVAVVLLAWLGISLLHAVLWCIPTLLCGLVSKRIKSPFALSAVITVGILIAEKLPYLSELAFPWVRFSVSQYRATALIQSASLFGIDGLDIIILSVNSLLALMLISPFKRKKLLALLSVGIFTLNLAFGLVRLNIKPETDGEINILTVQGSIETADKWKANSESFCFKTYKNLTVDNITDSTELVIWPESAVPTEYKSNKALKDYTKLSEKIKRPIIAGILKRENDVLSNTSIMINGKSIEKVYTKRILVPFGEYMPYRSLLSRLFPFLENLNMLSEDCKVGTDTALMTVKDKKIGNIICFESIYPKLSRKSTLDGAQLLLEVTNDSWLEDSPAMKQHLAHGILRSVENSRWLVRSANSGISAVIDSRGRVINELSALKQGAISATVSFENERTLYTATGDVTFPVFVLLTAFWCLIHLFLGKK